jgi:hypothetical protein
MDLDRFEALAGAYGGDIGRWPLDDREAARRLAAAGGPAAAILAREAAFDSTLSQGHALAPRAALMGAVLSAAPREIGRASHKIWRWLTGAGVGAALAGACAAGVLVGAYVVPAEWAHRSVDATDAADAALALIADGEADG